MNHSPSTPLKHIVSKNQMSLNIRNKSLSSSILSTKSARKDNGIKLASSYYNDRRQIYLKQSRTLSEKSKRYQTKEISFSERRKYS